MCHCTYMSQYPCALVPACPTPKSFNPICITPICPDILLGTQLLFIVWCSGPLKIIFASCCPALSPSDLALPLIPEKPLSFSKDKTY